MVNYFFYSVGILFNANNLKYKSVKDTQAILTDI